MGRKPNQLLQEFFERGKKLDDASNRYQQTCRRCCELFPKGRIDSLTGHLLRKCPNVSKVDRETVFYYLQQNPSTKTAAARKAKTSSTKPISPHSIEIQTDSGPIPDHHQDQLFAQESLSLPLSLSQQQSALDTLAEVSRRHLDYSQSRLPSNGPVAEQNIFPEQDRTLVEQALLLELQQGGVSQAPVTSEVNDDFYAPDFSYNSRVGISTSLPEHSRPQLPISQALQDEQRQESGVVINEGSVPPLDPQLGNVIPPLQQSLHGTDNTVTQEDLMTWNPTNPSGKQTFGALTAPSSEPIPGFGLLQKQSKTRTRGHFTDSRRKEVQEIRKRGACIRCRMLKKPCSDGTPCKTCANVESARLWKGKCLRTKLAAEFGLWSAGLYYGRANIEVPAAVLGLHQLPSPRKLEARLLEGSDACMNFTVKRYVAQGLTHPDDESTASFRPETGTRSIWLLDEGESLSNKVEAYFNDTSGFLKIPMDSEFLIATLDRAQHVAKEKTAIGVESPQNAGRSCYSLRSQLLQNTIELLAETRILANPGSMYLDLTSTEDESDNERMTAGSENYELVKIQILAAIESRCARLAKTVINELERRLLQRQQVSRFATFLSAVLLLSSVEQMTGFYWTFDRDGEFESKHGIASWPIDAQPCKMWPQGEHFADLLVMLLRMRALPPKTISTEDGTLVVGKDEGLPVHVNGKPLKNSENGQTKQAAEWLDPLNLQIGELLAKRDGESPDDDADQSGWEMRFLSKLLLPEKMK